jgi:hypothetical protein
MSLNDLIVATSLCQAFPEPIGNGKRRLSSMSSSVASESSLSNYHKAPGSEREDTQVRMIFVSETRKLQKGTCQIVLAVKVDFLLQVQT